MIVEAPVFGRERCLDQMIGEILDLQGVIMLDAAAADDVAVAVEERDRELRLLQPVVVAGVVECRHRERQHEDQAGRPDGRPLGGDFDQPPPPAGHVEAIHEGGVALVDIGQPASGLEQRAIDARVRCEQDMPEPLPPAWASGVALCQTNTSLGPGECAMADKLKLSAPAIFSPSDAAGPCRDGGKMGSGNGSPTGQPQSAIYP